MQIRIMHGHAKKSLNDCIPFQPMADFFSIKLRGISQQNCHLLILDGQGWHVTIKPLQQGTKFALGMVTLPSHTSHAL